MSTLPLVARLRALVLLNGGLLVTSFVATFFVGYVAREQASPTARPLAAHFDGLTIVSTVLIVTLFAVAVRAFLRTRREAMARAREAGDAANANPFVWSARLVPVTLALGGVSGAFYGLRAAGEAAAHEKALVQELCDEVLPAATDEARAACFAPAAACRRAKQRGTTLHDGRLQCVREALGIAD